MGNNNGIPDRMEADAAARAMMELDGVGVVTGHDAYYGLQEMSRHEKWIMRHIIEKARKNGADSLTPEEKALVGSIIENDSIDERENPVVGEEITRQQNHEEYLQYCEKAARDLNGRVVHTITYPEFGED